jgi:hypothetical protein
MIRRAIFATAASIVAMSAAAAQEVESETVATEPLEAEIIELTGWNYDEELYANGQSAEEFIDEMDVYDVAGDEIGDVEDILIGVDGKILARSNKALRRSARPSAAARPGRPTNIMTGKDATNVAPLLCGRPRRGSLVGRAAS